MKTLPPAAAADLQRELSGSLREAPAPRPRDGLLIGGADCSYQRGALLGYGAIVIYRWPELEVVETATASAPLEFPYIPGLLSFRELPLLSPAWEILRTKPDLLLVDGQGYAHPRRFGLACHLGVVWDTPTIGVGKSVLIGTYRAPGRDRGSGAGLTDDGEEIGRVVRTRTGVKPVVVSQGHRMNLSSAVNWVLRLAPRTRLPEPIRGAHQAVSAARRQQI